MSSTGIDTLIDDYSVCGKDLIPLPASFSISWSVSSLQFGSFAIEVDGNRINFLNLIVWIDSGAHMITEGLSFFPWTHKLTAFNCYIHRLVLIPMGKSDFDAEVNSSEYLTIDLNIWYGRKSWGIFFSTDLKRKRGEKWIKLPILGSFCKSFATLFGHTVSNQFVITSLPSNTFSRLLKTLFLMMRRVWSINWNIRIVQVCT